MGDGRSEIGDRRWGAVQGIMKWSRSRSAGNRNGCRVRCETARATGVESDWSDAVLPQSGNLGRRLSLRFPG